MTPEQVKAQLLAEGYSPDEVSSAFTAVAAEPKTSVGEAFMGGIGKAGWAIPSLVGVDAPVAEAFYQALKDRASGKSADLSARYRELEPQFRDKYRTMSAEHPWADTVGGAVGGTAATLLTAGAGGSMQAAAAPTLTGLTRAEQALALGKSGLIQGALSGSSQPAGSVPERLANMGKGASAGALMAGGIGAALPTQSAGAAAAKEMGIPVGAAGGHSTVPPAVTTRVAQAISGESKPTAEAQFLMSKGVRLTRGMQDPGSSANQLEQALQSTHPYGSTIANQRAVAASDFRIAAANEALAPGMKRFPVGTDLGEAVSAIESGFSSAYGQVGSHPLYPAVHGAGGGPLQGTAKTPGLVEQAVDTVKRLTDSQRGAIKDDVLDLLTKLPPRKGAIGQVDASDLIDVRSIVRSRAREYGAAHTPEGTAAKEAYDAVEHELTRALETQIPDEALALLRATDAKYRQFKILDAAMQSARGAGGEFTTRQLAMAASHGERGFRTATDEVGPLYDLAVAGNRVLAGTVKPTGERVAILQTAGKFIPEWVTKRAAGMATTHANEVAMNPGPVPAQASAPSPAGVVPQSGWMSPLGISSAQAIQDPRQEAPQQQQGAGASSLAPSHSTPAMGTEAIIGRLSSRPNMGHYANLLRKAGTGAGALHFELYEKDPTYRAAVMAGEQSK